MTDIDKGDRSSYLLIVSYGWESNMVGVTVIINLLLSVYDKSCWHNLWLIRLQNSLKATSDALTCIYFTSRDRTPSAHLLAVGIENIKTQLSARGLIKSVVIVVS